MKKSDIKYDVLINYDLIKQSYKEVMKNIVHKNKIMNFDLFYSENISKIYDEIKNKRYKHGQYSIFLITDPKYRIVMSESVQDKVVNHMVTNAILNPVLSKKLIEENVATRKNKGTKAGFDYTKKYFLKYMNKYEKFYILKFDITKYFYNINHEILKEMMRSIYKDEDIIKILDELIDSTDKEYINKNIDKIIQKELKSNLSDYCKTELSKIPRYNKEVGLSIGAVSNQIFACYYLNSLDHYIKEVLHIKEYVRFQEDGIIFSNSKEELVKIKELIKAFLNDKLKLKLNEKTDIYSSNDGLDFVGYRFYVKNKKLIIRLRKWTKKKMQHKFKVLRKYNVEKYMKVYGSYKGMMLYITPKYLYKQELKKYNNWIFL